MQDTIQPRYALYLKINSTPENWEYVNWIAAMGSEYRKKIGVDRFAPIAFDSGFDNYLQNEVNNIIMGGLNDSTTITI